MVTALDCLTEHLAAENRHDLDGIMATYVSDPRVTINGQTFRGQEKVQLFHQPFGFGGDGAFSEPAVRERTRHVSGDAVYRQLGIAS